MYKLIILASIVSLTSALAQSDTGVHTSDGCGLGWQVTPKRSMLATTTRGTTNNFVPPTFGMTSGTIGCKQFSFASNEDSAVQFALANEEALRVEMAQGHGEYIAGLAQAMGCTDVNAFGQLAQKHYNSIVGQRNSGAEIYDNLKKEIAKDPQIASTCGA